MIVATSQIMKDLFITLPSHWLLKQLLYHFTTRPASSSLDSLKSQEQGWLTSHGHMDQIEYQIFGGVGVLPQQIQLALHTI